MLVMTASVPEKCFKKYFSGPVSYLFVFFPSPFLVLVDWKCLRNTPT